jgi:hypothetical protein
MAIPSYLLAFLVAFSVAILGILIVRFNQKKCQRQRLLRKELVERIKASPMPGLFRTLGINFGNYFYSSPVSEVDATVQLCENCSRTNQCTSKLSNPETDHNDLDFCPVKQFLNSRT